MVQVPVGKDYRLSADTARKYITRNTILIVASSPGFPHGVMDDVPSLAKVGPASLLDLLLSVCSDVGRGGGICWCKAIHDVTIELHCHLVTVRVACFKQ